MGQYKVPQDVQREDKVFGPFSLRQFLYLIAGAATGYMFFTIFSRLTSTFIGSFVGLMFLAFFGAFAFVQIQGKELPDFMLALIVYLLKPSKRVWKKDFSMPDVAFIPKKKEEKEEEPIPTKTNLEQLAHILDTRGWAELAQREEKKEIEKIHEKVTEEPEKTSEIPPPPPPAISKVSQKTETDKKIIKQEEETKDSEKIKKAAPAPPMPPKIETKKEVVAKQAISLDQEQAKQKEAEIEKELAKIEEKTQKALRKKIKKEVRENIKEKKQEVKEFKKSISKIEKKIPKKIKKVKTKKASKPKDELGFKKAYAEAYTFNLGGRVTTPRIKEESTNIKVDESLLDDMLEETEEMKTIKKELTEVGKAIKACAKAKKKPRIVKEGEAFYQ